jgi:hypothetical protein
MDAEAVLARYRERGTAEGFIPLNAPTGQ